MAAPIGEIHGQWNGEERRMQSSGLPAGMQDRRVNRSGLTAVPTDGFDTMAPTPEPLEGSDAAISGIQVQSVGNLALVDNHNAIDTPALDPSFRLRLTSELKDPEHGRGHVMAVNKLEAVSEQGHQLPCEVSEILVHDPYIAADPETYSTVKQYIDGIEARLVRDGFDPKARRTEALTPDEWNEYTRAWLSAEDVAGLAIWRGLVPTAEALKYLTTPSVNSIIANRAEETAIISPETAAQLRFVDDAIGIRDRGVAMAHLLTEHFEGMGNYGEANVLSLASGTAEPMIAATRYAQEKTGRKVTMTAADQDGRSLSYVRSNAERYGIDPNVITTIKMNILTPDLQAEVARESGTPQYDVVEDMGFEEYLPEDGDEMEAFKGAGLPQASEFTRRAFELVKPGGILLSGNMVLDRPQLNFVFGVVDWPLINARSEQSILRVYEKAGLLNNPKAKVEMFRVRDAIAGTHVYNIVRVTKLA